MADVEKPTGTAATEVMGEMWPPESETSYFAKANELLSLAGQAQKNAQTTTATATYTGQETDGKAYNAILEQLQLKANAFTVHADEMAKAAGWVKHMGEQIQATKKKIAAEVKAHESKCITGKTIDTPAEMLEESQDVATRKANVTAAMAALETDLTAGEAACASDVIGAPPGGTPAIPDDDVIGTTDAPSDAPATDPTATAPTPATAPGTTAPGGGSEGAGAGGGSTAPAAPAAALPTEAFAAPAASPAAAPAEAMSGSPASAPADAAGGGMPMSGMPMGGMPMQPPQMPAGGAGAGQTPGNDLAKTVGDTVSKLARPDGTPVSEAALSKLLDAQGDGTGEGGPGGDKGANGEDPDKLPDGVDPLEKVFGNEPGAGGNSGVTAQERGALDPYSSANQNPSLNNPTPPHLASPSPAAPVITQAPSAPTSAPMTELSADPNYIGAQQHQAPALSPESVTTHPSAGPGSPAGPAPAGPGPAGANPGGGPQPGQALGAYNPGAMGSPAPMAPMPMGGMGAMGGMMPPPAAGGGAAAPVLAAAVPAAAVAEAATSGRRRSPEIPTRLSSLPPEHAAAEHHLAALVRVFAQRNWPTAVLAIACLEGQHGVRYLLATADGVSLVPLGVPLPGGVELLSSQPLSGSFAADWAGHVHPARKLAAWAGEHPEAGRLVYLVSNDASGVPAVAGSVVEVRQTQAERSGMGGGSPAILPRTSLAFDTIPAAKAEDALEAFANAWGISDATADDWRVAPGRLWAARWDRDRPADYPAILATYLYVEGLEAVREGRAADAAYSASALATVRPYDWAAA